MTTATRPIRPKNQKACCIVFCSARPTPATWCWIRSSEPAPRALWQKCWAGISSASSAKRHIARSPKSACRAFASSTARRLQVSTSKRAEPRVPFGQLVERGMLRPGEMLRSMNGRHAAKVRADGTLISDDVRGSIHQVGAALGRRAQLQWLDLLVLQTRRTAGADRPAPPTDTVRTGLTDVTAGACGLTPRH